jgi:ATP-binding cassette, subfamily B, bacterial
MSEAALYWPMSRSAEGLELLARAAKLPLHLSQAAVRDGRGPLNEPLSRTAARMGLEAEAVNASFAEIPGLLRSAGPAALRVGVDALVFIVRGGGRRVTIVRPDHRTVTVPLSVLTHALGAAEQEPLVAETERLVDDIGVPAGRRGKIVRALLAERTRARRLEAGWLIRVPIGTSLRSQLSASGARRQALLLTLIHAAQYVATLAAWWLLGRAALLGHLDASWLAAWALALFTIIPLQVTALWLQGRLAIGAGALLKQRLLAGAFRLNPEEIRREGAGQLLGRVIEAEAVESLALGGGLTAGLAALELVLAAGVLALASPGLSFLLVIWTVLSAALAWRYFRRRSAWVQQRISLTHDLIERMLGHRTRLAQQSRERWHDGEDEALDRYLQSSVLMDRAAVRLLAFVPRGWMLVGLCGLTPLFVGGRSTGTLAVAAGGILLGYRALDRLTNGLWSLTGAAIAWQQTAPVFQAAGRTAQGQGLDAAAASTQTETALNTPVLEATDLRFTHQGRADAVLQGCSLTLARGERLILRGESGGGKSTLAALLSGLRTPQSGLLLLNGLDAHTHGPDGWRRRVVLVPQFHENHLVLGTVAFNTLMGSEWPPAAEDFGRAETLLRELGLGATLDRMPSGVLQTIGETGWQLSHGERSRIYLARALLQNPEVLILDESFAQLDPETMSLALDAVVSRASTVVLIAHP